MQREVKKAEIYTNNKNERIGDKYNPINELEWMDSRKMYGKNGANFIFNDKITILCVSFGISSTAVAINLLIIYKFWAFIKYSAFYIVQE